MTFSLPGRLINALHLCPLLTHETPLYFDECFVGRLLKRFCDLVQARMFFRLLSSPLPFRWSVSIPAGTSIISLCIQTLTRRSSIISTRLAYHFPEGVRCASQQYSLMCSKSLLSTSAHFPLLSLMRLTRAPGIPERKVRRATRTDLSPPCPCIRAGGRAPRPFA